MAMTTRRQAHRAEEMHPAVPHPGMEWGLAWPGQMKIERRGSLRARTVPAPARRLAQRPV